MLRWLSSIADISGWCKHKFHVSMQIFLEKFLQLNFDPPWTTWYWIILVWLSNDDSSPSWSVLLFWISSWHYSARWSFQNLLNKLLHGIFTQNDVGMFDQVMKIKKQDAQATWSNWIITLSRVLAAWNEMKS